MARLNITYNGLSVDVPLELDYQASDADIRRIAVELIRSGAAPGLRIANIGEHAFTSYVVDRFDTDSGGRCIFLRPKVPFGLS